MASVAYLDTHVVAWMYGRGREALSTTAQQTLGRAEALRISPMVRLELQYLFEIGRVGRSAGEVLADLGSVIGLSVCQEPFGAVVALAEGYSWTRDPFDRLIVAQAALGDHVLVTKDASIQAHYEHALW